MEGQTFGVIGARELQNAAELALFISTVRKHYELYKTPQPRLPDYVLELAPCDFAVTETYGPNGLITGRVLITGPQGNVLYDEEWLVSAGKT